MLEIKVWQSYSCNNSSSFRLVARFKDTKTAADVTRELSAMFQANAREMDSLLDSGDYDWAKPQPSASAKAFGAKYGIRWTDALFFGDGEQVGDEPTVASAGPTVAIYHSYCNGFGHDIRKYIGKRGGAFTKEKYGPELVGPPEITVLFRVAAGKSRISGELAALFAPRAPKAKPKLPPWTKGRYRLEWGREAFFFDGKTIGFHMPINPEDVDPLRAWLRKNGVQNPIITLGEAENADKIEKIAKATCDACGASPLAYVEPSMDNVDAEQLACAKCGGMFELAKIKLPAPPVEKAKATPKAKAKAKAKATAKAKPKAKAKR